MAHDPYAPCICGNGKKLKFCCQDILSDMIRIEKLIDNQPDAAEKLLRSLLKKHDDKEVLVTQLASILTRKGEFEEARTQLVDFLKRHPDEPRALLALADVCITTQGFGATRRIVHRAFQLGARQFPAGVAMLASRIAGQMAQAGCAMSVREHLALAVRMSPPDRRNSLLMQLANFESQRTIPYPFRGRFALLPVELEDPQLQKEDVRARKVSQIGCWEPAAILYSRLVEKCPENGALWYNLGLFRAWDGRLKEAAEALHKAGSVLEDFDSAVEAEALAQLIDLEISQDNYAIVQETVNVSSVSELLTRMDAAGRFARVQSSNNEDQVEGSRVAAEFEFLTEEAAEKPDPAQLPDVIADITILDSDENSGGPRALIVALEDDVEKAISAFRELAEDLAAEPEEGSRNQLSRMPSQCRLFDWKIHHADGIGSSRFRELDQERLANALQNWLSSPLAALGDASPADAAKDDDNKVRVGGSVLTLDVICNRMGYDPDLSGVREQLGVTPPAPMPIDESSSITSLPLLQFGRVAETDLTDEQVIEFTNRITLVRHLRLLERAVEELVKRPAALEQFTPMRGHLLRATVAREKNDMQTASECFEAARNAIADDPDAFRTRLELDIRELSCRLDNPHDEELPGLLEGIRDRYFVKIPEIEDVIREELENSGCVHLLDQLAPVTATSKDGVWTPEGESEPAEGGGKLWMPGDS
ncbi:MAG: tetratricopeptide repeat protein [Planctomycetaceae bacterium]|nr:tetratricopeptide repeat protein [Planctomycetaceae bacterium]